MVDSQDSFRTKDVWTKFLPNVAKVGPKEEQKEQGKSEEAEREQAKAL